MKTKQLVSTLLIATSLLSAVPVFALSPEELATRTQKEQTVFKNIQNGVTSLPSRGEYIADVSFKDRLGNYLRGYTKWYGHGITLEERRNEPFDIPYTVDREGYKTAKVQVSSNKAGRTSKTVVLEPSKINNIIMGTVVFPEGVEKTNWYIQVIDTTKKIVDAESAFIKVQENGTFKMYNLPNGTYQFNVVRVNNNNIDERVAELGSEVIKINGNLNKEFKFESTDYVDTLDITELFNEVDYSNPQSFIYNDEFIELPQEWKDKVDKEISDGKNMQTLLDINDIIYDNFNKANTPTDGQPMSVKSIIEQGYASECTQFATVFQSIANYKGIPTRVLFGLKKEYIDRVKATGNFGGVFVHVFLEAYVDGKWVLVDPTGSPIVADYDKDDNNIVTGYGHYYVVANMSTPEPLNNFLTMENVNRNVAASMDMSLFSTDTKNDMVKYNVYLTGN